MDCRLKCSAERTGLLVVISGPSGVGKGTLLKKLLTVCPDTAKSITCTTREPRPGEVHGIDYFFVSTEEFKRMIDAGEFLEYAQVHLNLYGTPQTSTNHIRSQGIDTILEIDVQGGITVKRKVPDTVMIFVAPPSMAELEDRLRGRGTEADEVVAKRLDNARGEMDCIPLYDYLVVNDDIDTAVDALRSIIIAERSKIRTQKAE
ncbi:MAG: guanylate kinase [Armatimonadota bacterium]